MFGSLGDYIYIGYISHPWETVRSEKRMNQTSEFVCTGKKGPKKNLHWLALSWTRTWYQITFQIFQYWQIFVPVILCLCFLLEFGIQIFWYWKSSQTCSSCWPQMILGRFKIQKQFSRLDIIWKQGHCTGKAPNQQISLEKQCMRQNLPLKQSKSQKLKHSNSQKSQIE